MSPRRGGGCLGDALIGPPAEARRRQRRPARRPEASPGGGGVGGGLEEPRTRRRPRSPRRGRRAPPGEDEGGGRRRLHDQPVGAAGPEPLGPRDGAEEPHGDVVLDLPLGPLLLSVRPRCCRSPDVRDAAETSARASHLRHRRQHRLSGLRDWSDDHYRILGESIFNETVNLMLGLSAPGRGGSYLATRPVKFGSSSVLLWKQNPRGRGEKDSSQKAGWGPRWERRGRGPALDGQERTF
ncbi:transmembrane protein 170B isoform X1 [Moschus berezovskii]|uniref:transmembrane protein 170B isoform X1 n=1 Tax=Moschus berezovskii TaxID=68408 RepID=UPI00244524DF|nr:transmembrane protein 170B isoform X1 [Moschus berezovskii]